MAPTKRATLDPGLFAKTEPEQASLQAPEGHKVPVSFYLASGLADGLEDALGTLRMIGRKQGKRRRVTKSAILEAALRAALEDLEARGQDSLLARLLD